MLTTRRSIPMLFLALLAGTACQTYRNTGGRPITPQRDIRMQFASPVTIAIVCDAADSLVRASGGCATDRSAIPDVAELTGRVYRVKRDSFLIEVQQVRASSGHWRKVVPPRLTVLARHAAFVQDRHTSAPKTILLVVLGAGLVALVAVLLQPEPAPPPPKTGY